MQEPTIESLQARIAELERKLPSADKPAKDWWRVIGLFDDSELMPQIIAEGQA